MKPRPFLLVAGLVSLVSIAPAFDLGGLSKGIDLLNKAKEKKATVDEYTNDATKLASGIGPEEERALGETVALEIVGKFGGLVRDEATVRRVNLIGHALARYSSRPDHPWRFGVLDSDTVNAFSAPDGYVFITRGLYETATDDDQLAAILGHEISHITGRDALRIIEKGEKGSIGMKYISRQSGDVRQIEAFANQLGVNTDKIVKFLVEKGYDHPVEYAADQNGHDLAVVTGYASGGLRAVLQDLQSRPNTSKKIFQAHPPLAERLKRLKD
jgi:predicted Zn-dependent protease